MKLKDGFDSNYRYVLVAARRARQLSGGAPRLVETNASKPCKIAQQEIDAGKIQFIVKGQSGRTGRRRKRLLQKRANSAICPISRKIVRHSLGWSRLTYVTMPLLAPGLQSLYEDRPGCHRRNRGL